MHTPVGQHGRAGCKAPHLEGMKAHFNAYANPPTPHTCIPQVDGMDVLAVKHAVAFAKDYALANGPIIMEMDTYRWVRVYSGRRVRVY